MKNPRLSTYFPAYSDQDFLGKAKQILAGISSPVFVNPNPAVQTLTAGIDNYAVKLTAAANLGRNEVAEKNAARQEVEDMLVQLAPYVMNIANGDMVILTASGFTVEKAREPRYITNPGNVTLSNGITSGCLVAAVKSVGNARSYVHEICDTPPAADTVWTAVPTTTAKYTYTELTPGKQYWVRVAAIGARQQKAYSPVNSMFVQ